MTIPNIITILRLCSVPFLILLLVEGEFQWALLLFVISGISDAVDGIIARHVPGQGSALGRYLDPIADKALLVSIYVTLGITGHVPIWVVILIASRDLMIVGGVLLAWMMARPVEIEPIFLSKANTAVQIVYATVLIAELAFPWHSDFVFYALEWSVAALTVASAAAYLMAWVRHMSTPLQGG